MLESIGTIRFDLEWSWKVKFKVTHIQTFISQQEAQGPWRSAWTEDPVHKNVLKSCK